MQVHSSRIEGELISLLNKQGEFYTEAICLVRSINSNGGHATLRVTEITGRVRDLMQQVDGLRQPIGELRSTLVSTGEPRSDRLKSTVALQEELLRAFITEVDRSKEHVHGQQQRLMPSLDTEAQRSSMQSAYRVSMRTG